MRKGKLQQSVLVRSVLREIKTKKEQQILRPSVGVGAAAVQIKEGEACFSTAPVVLYDEEDAELAVCRVCNSILAAGGIPQGILLSLLLPETMEETELKSLMRVIEHACARYDAVILGGHTEVTGAVKDTVLTVTAQGMQKRETLCRPASLTGCCDLVVTKGIGLGAAAYLARTKREELLQNFSPYFVTEAELFSKNYSVAEEAETGLSFGVQAMQDLSEGGIFGALWEFADGAGTGLDISLKKIPIRQETVEICEYFGLNPYQILSTGSLLLATEDGEGLVHQLEQKGIFSAVIGRTTKGKDRIIRNGEEVRYLDKPQTDELYRIWEADADQK